MVGYLLPYEARCISHSRDTQGQRLILNPIPNLAPRAQACGLIQIRSRAHAEYILVRVIVVDTSWLLVAAVVF